MKDVSWPDNDTVANLLFETGVSLAPITCEPLNRIDLPQPAQTIVHVLSSGLISSSSVYLYPW